MRTAWVLIALLVAGCLPCAASRTVTDEVGRIVTVPDHPHRVICLAPSVTDDVFSVGAGDDVVAVSDYTKYPVEATKKPSVGSLTNPSLETIVALHPDLVIGVGHLNQSTTVEQLQRMAIPVFLVDPHGIDGIFHSIASVGVALNREQAAAALVARLRQRVAAVRESAKGKPVISVFMPVWYDPVITIGKGAFITEIVAAAGGRSVTDDVGQEWPHVSIEAVMERAPEALLLVRGGKTTLEVLKDRPVWSGLQAVKMRRVYYVDGRIDFPSPVAIDALEDLAKQFHS